MFLPSFIKSWKTKIEGRILYTTYFWFLTGEKGRVFNGISSIPVVHFGVTVVGGVRNYA